MLQTALVDPSEGFEELEPPPRGEGWQGGEWELVSHSYGPLRNGFFNDTRVWITIAWRRR